MIGFLFSAIIFWNPLLSDSADEIAVMQGHVHLGGLFEIFGDRECKNEIQATSIRNFEAVKWTLKKLNEANYIPGIKLGIEAFPTCNVYGRALEHTTRMINRKFHEPMKSNATPVIGLVGPEYSHEAVDVSSYISGLEKNNLILQTLFSTTASALSDGNKFQNILRVIPEDSKQILTIISLMEILDWNYVGVIYENNAYGIGNFQGFESKAKAKKICIAYSSAISQENGLVKSQELQKAIDLVIFHAESTITGVIVFASTKTVKVLLNVVNKLKQNYIFRLGLIFSEGSSTIDKNTLKLYDVSKGSFFSIPPVVSFKSFKTHWVNVLSNKTIFSQEMLSNPWLKKFVSCDIQSPSCSMPTKDDLDSVTGLNVFEGYAIISTILHAKILRDLHREMCEGVDGLCTNLNSTLWDNAYKLVLMGRNAKVSLKGDIPDELQQPLEITFKGNPNAYIFGNLPEYEVHHFRYCLRENQEVCLVKVGNYNNTTLDLNTTLLRDYTENANGLSWPDIIKAQCKDGKKCESCQNSNLFDEIIFKEGDFYVGAVVPVFNKDSNDPIKCGLIRDSNGWEIVEGIRFAVETVNKKLGRFAWMFGRNKIGYIIFNSCNQPFLIQEKLLGFFKERMQLSNGSHVLDVASKLLGFVAAYGSEISIATASILQKFDLPQISYASTAAVLSNRTTYKYFMRTCTPDDKQALAMVNIVKTLNSSYIQIMYSEGSYGEGGRNAIIRAANDMKICIANEIKVPQGDYAKIRDNLQKTPYATVVLLFLRSHVVQEVMTVLDKSIDPWPYLFIGSEAFGKQQSIIAGKHKLEGTISLSLQMTPDTGESKFEKYLHDILAEGDDINPWTKEYFETRNKCFLSGSFNKHSKSKCADIKAEFNNQDYQPELWTAFAINAMFSLLQGTNKSFADLCGSQSSTLCQKYRKSPKDVYDKIKNEKLVIDENKIPSKVFDENGDGNKGYEIYQVQRKASDASQLIFVEIGRYTLEENGYSIHNKRIKDPFKTLPSICPNPPECKRCMEQVGSQDKSTPVDG
ncbi:uncharacterized protein LOC134243176 [Saccostrea cucullata]|uniref:uncharacterized protein LOC134243176 n=1 Tax=Saccostrea cuccullata TaxID=36930 RepID=UPI002ED31C7B